MRLVLFLELEFFGDRLRWKGIGGFFVFFGFFFIVIGLLEFVFGFMGVGLFESVCFFVGFRDVFFFIGVGVRGLRENLDGILIVDFGLRVLKFFDNFGVGFGDGV